MFSLGVCRDCGNGYTASGNRQKRCVGCQHAFRLLTHRRSGTVHTCQVEGCVRPAVGHKTCNTHRMRVRIGIADRPDCAVDGCRLVACVDAAVCRRHRPKPEPKPRCSTCRCGESYHSRSGPHCPPLLTRNGKPKHTPPVEPSLHQCRTCGADFMAKCAYTFCSPQCRRNDPGYRDQRRKGKALRRARKHLATVEPVSPRRVFERDGWMCGICHRPVPRGTVVPHPLAPTLDHIIPLSGGGDHSYSNTQCAHFICNVRKGAGDGQLRLAM